MAALELRQTTLFNDANLQGYWRMEGNSNDSSKNGYNGTDTAITYNASYGKFGQGALFNGTTSLIVTSSGATNLDLKSTWTMMAWLNFTTGGDEMAISWGELSAGKRRALWVNGTTGAVNFSGYSANVTGTTGWNDGVWHLIAITCSGANHIIIYVDGTSRASGDPTLNTFTYAGTGIGANAQTGENYAGDIDDVAIFNRVLTATEISNHYLGLDSSITTNHLLDYRGRESFR